MAGKSSTKRMKATKKAGRGSANRGGKSTTGRRSLAKGKGAARPGKPSRKKATSARSARSRKPARLGGRPFWWPEGYHTLTPSLIVRDADAAIAFYKKAFGAEEVMCLRSPDGGVMHAEMRIGDSTFMLGGEWPDHGMRAPLPHHVSGGLQAYVADVDAAVERAVSAGCRVAMPVGNMFWGDRYGKVLDPFGHLWGFATRIEKVSPEECARRAASWQP